MTERDILVFVLALLIGVTLAGPMPPRFRG